jgi:amino acid adenylation domain-containing protein/thioester reductase-like protein
MSSETVLRHFARQVASNPHSVAVIDETERLTYRELDRKSSRISEFLIENGIAKGNIVPILADRSINLFIAVLGVLKVGAAYIPVDRKYPDQRKAHIAEQSGASLMLSTKPCADSGGKQRIEDVNSILARCTTSDFEGIEADAHDPVYVVFTSGTTGMPKGVVVEHHSLINLVLWHNDKFDMQTSSRTTLMAGVGFDVSQWEIWSTLVAGACIHLLNDEMRLNSQARLDFYTRHGITHAFEPTVLVPDSIAEPQPDGLVLHYLFTAGEKLNPVNTDALRYTLVDYYGPTEATIFATFHLVKSMTLNPPSSIGTPVADTEVFILGDDFSTLGVGEIGELFIAGRCLARGYLNDDELTAEKFVFHSKFPGKRLYRTGDLACWLPDGSIQFIGRADDQIKIRGNRVELGEVEAAVVRDPGVRAAVALVDGASSQADKKIIAFVVPRNGRTDRASVEMLVDRLKNGLRRLLPDYMLPSHYLCIDAIPYNANGKKDKQTLHAIYLGTLDQPRLQVEMTGEYETEIADIWSALLGHTDFGTSDSFFEVGGHSLRVTSLVREISNRLGVKTYVSDIYEHKSISLLAKEIRQRKRQTTPLLDSEPLRVLQDDINLPEGIVFSCGFAVDQIVEPRHILLTGVTGFVGVHLLAELLATTRADIHCLVRGKTFDVAVRRVDEVMSRYQVDIPPLSRTRIKIHVGDISEKSFDMSPHAFASLAGRVDVIYHSASAVNFIQPYSHMKKDNVQGLKEIIRFAGEEKIKPLILLSTISVYSHGHLHTGKTLMREDDGIDQNLPAIINDLGYVRSKWVMEKIADLAASQGLPLMVFRLGYATFHSQTGLCADYQWWGRLVKTCIAYNSIPDLRDLREGLTTIDYIAAAIAFISRIPEALSKKFNLIPSPQKNLTLREFFKLLGDSSGIELEVMPYQAWLAQWESDRDAPLYPLLSMFKDNMYDGMSIVELYQNTYLWDCSNVRNFLENSSVREPKFTEEILARYLKNSIGFIPERRPCTSSRILPRGAL